MTSYGIQMSGGGARSRRVPWWILVPLLQGISIPAAHAQDGSATDTAAARALAVEGLKLADAGNCAEAIEKLARAEKLHHGPIVLGRLGECSVAQGKIVDGTEMLRRMLREPLPSNPSPALLKAREHAQATLELAKPKIGMITISITGPREDTLAVTVDGQSVSAALLDTARPTDPGEHVVEASAPGYLKASKHVTVTTGEKQSVALELAPDPQAAAAAANPPPTATPSTLLPPPSFGTREPSMTTGADTGAPRMAPNRAPAYVALAVGGASLVVGAGFGVVALKGKSDLQKECNGNNVCPSTSEQRLNSATTAGTVSTIAFGVGAAGVILGAVLFATAGSSSTGSAGERSLATASPHGSGVVARGYVGVGQLGVTGTF